MQPGAITPELVAQFPSLLSLATHSTSSSLVSSNVFSVLPEVVLKDTGYMLPAVSCKSQQRLARCHHLGATLKISSISVLSLSSVLKCNDLGSDNPITLPCLVNENLPATCMIDSGASSQFIDRDFALNMNLKLDLKEKPEDLVLADGVRSKVRQITHTCTLRVTIDQHLEDLTFHVTKPPGWNLNVGKPWLRRHNPTIDWTRNSVTFTSAYCHTHCLPTRVETTDSTTPKKPIGISLISRAALGVAIRQPKAECFVICLMANSNIKTTELDLATQLVLPEYHDYLSIFSEEEARTLPPQQYVDHAIPLIDGGKPSFGRMYLMSDTNLKELE